MEVRIAYRMQVTMNNLIEMEIAQSSCGLSDLHTAMAVVKLCIPAAWALATYPYINEYWQSQVVL